MLSNPNPCIECFFKKMNVEIIKLDKSFKPEVMTKQKNGWMDN